MLKVVNHCLISEMDEDEDDEGLLEPALAVDLDDDDVAFDLNIPPTTGNEYLRRVREEAKKCPKVVVANLDTNVYQHKQTIRIQPKDTMPAPAGFSPSAAWIKIQVTDFVNLRQKIAHFKALLAKNKVSLPVVKLPQHNDAENWCRLCFGRMQLKVITDPNGKGQTCLQNDGNGTPPLLSIVTRMDQPTVIKVLEYHVNWLEATGFTHRQGQWFYSLLACLQKPLTPESCSWLRQLARICSIVRATLKSPEEGMLLELNLLISLVAHYFDQGDLADKI